MNCEFRQEMVSIYFDGELDPLQASEFEDHLEICSECGESLETTKSLHAQLQRLDLFEHARPEFHHAIRKQLEMVEPTSGNTSSFLTPRLGGAAFALLGVAVAVLSTVIVFRPHAGANLIAAELIDAHIRSLQAGHLVDVQSANQHTVKPWFQGKLSFIPPVTDYTDQGFPLAGGRLDVMDGHEIASIIYSHQQHVINVFVWSKEKEIGFARSGTSRGYHWLIWRHGDMVFCAISDAAPSSLEQLKGLLSS